MRRPLISALLPLALLAAPAVGSAKQAPDNWEGLTKVKSKKVDLVYLRPAADFRGYTKVLIDPVQVAFRKDWQRDHQGMVGQVDNADVRRILDEAQSGLQKLFADAYRKAGYEVVEAAGPDVLRISSAVINLDIEAPDTLSPGITRVYTREAGSAVLVVEARDSLSLALLGRAVDGRAAGDSFPYQRNRASNEVDFERLFSDWAKISANGLDELKALSPIGAGGKPVTR